jgi:hypothetical protein
MKIKLQEYSLISNDWIDTWIGTLSTECKMMIKKNYSTSSISQIQNRLQVLETIKEQLIPAEKLAELCLDKIIETMPPALAIHYLEYKKDFIKSKIEIQ